MKNITRIEYPNNSEHEDFVVSWQTKQFSSSYSNCDELRLIQKNGEMALINWIQVIKDNKIIAEIKESVCNIYGSDELEELKNKE